MVSTCIHCIVVLKLTVIEVILRRSRESLESIRHKLSAVFLWYLYKVLDGYKTVNGEVIYMKRQKRDKLG